MRILFVAALALVHGWGVPALQPSAGPSPFAPNKPVGTGAAGHQIDSPFGPYDKEVVFAVVRRHIDEVSGCYKQALARDSSLFGRVIVQSTIAASGEVIASVLQSSTLGNPVVESCMVATVSGWQFPKPIGGGTVIVSNPFVFIPEEPFRLSAPGTDIGFVEIHVLNLNTFVHRSVPTNGVWSNGMIRVTDQGLLLVDTAWTDAQTEAILSWGEKRLGKRWIGAVITHEHNDRDGGIGALERRQIPIAALDLTVAKLEKRGVHSARVLFAAKGIAFKDPRGFEAFYPGPGHAPDNIVLRFPDVVFGGWPAAVSAVSARYGKTTVVPGHGAVDSEGKSYERTLELLRAANK
jgi:metallo-beta-lactamase class B